VGLAKLILRRIALGLLTLFMVSLVVFAATQALPGDAAHAILGKSATPERLTALRAQLGLDRPKTTQYALWLKGAVVGNFGTSLAQGTSVTSLLGFRLKNTAALVFWSALISVPLSILIGAYSAYRRDGPFDTAHSVVSLSLASLPEFVIGILLIMLFATQVFHVFPAISRIPSGQSVWSSPERIVLPVLALVLSVQPYISRILRASLIDVMESDYVQMARLKGLKERTVVARHALPNGLAPTIQATAISLAWLAGGVVVIEYLFAFPGIGSLYVDAVGSRDVPVIQAITLIIAALYIGLNLAADIITILISPRLRTSLQ
jgi:peptide/nickel transport system permease protein